MTLPARIMDGEPRYCGDRGKIIYATKPAPAVARKRLIARGQRDLSIFLCTTCKGWHLGRGHGR